MSPQYASKRLSGTEIISFNNIAQIEDELGNPCLAIV